MSMPDPRVEKISYEDERLWVCEHGSKWIDRNAVNPCYFCGDTENEQWLPHHEALGHNTEPNA
jgi:hypothetical protein